MAEQVINVFEMVGIHQQQAKLLLRGKMMGIGLVGDDIELTPVEQARHGITQCRVFQLLL